MFRIVHLNGPVVASVGNAISFTPQVSPGSLMAIYGTNLGYPLLPNLPGLPLTASQALVSVTVNGWPAPIFYASPTQINVQVPYEAERGLRYWDQYLSAILQRSWRFFSATEPVAQRRAKRSPVSDPTRRAGHRHFKSSHPHNKAATQPSTGREPERSASRSPAVFRLVTGTSVPGPADSATPGST